MSCPLFLPANPLSEAVPAAAPLGDLHGGSCASAPEISLSLDVLRRCCNSGYARGECPRAAAAEVDAARFLIKSDRDGVIEVAWAHERDHYPFDVGVMGYSPELAVSSEPLQRQVAAYVACYLRQNGRLRHP